MEEGKSGGMEGVRIADFRGFYGFSRILGVLFIIGICKDGGFGRSRSGDRSYSFSRIFAFSF